MILQRDVQYLPECVYIGSWKDVSDAIFNGRAPKHSTFFVAGGSCSSDKNICQCPYNIVFTDLSIPLLNNILNSALVKLRSLEDADTRLNFNNFLYEILLNSKLGSEEIQEMVDSLDFNLKKYLNIIVINFSNSKTLSIESPKIFSELEPLFAQCNMSVFAKKITILYTSDEKQVSMPKELAQRFNAFLEKYDAFASFGMPFRKCSVIRTKYYIVANILRIAMRLEDRTTRVYSTKRITAPMLLSICAPDSMKPFWATTISYILVIPDLLSLHGTISSTNPISEMCCTAISATTATCPKPLRKCSCTEIRSLIK